jgi:hypothetical protein
MMSKFQLQLEPQLVLMSETGAGPFPPYPAARRRHGRGRGRLPRLAASHAETPDPRRATRTGGATVGAGGAISRALLTLRTRLPRLGAIQWGIAGRAACRPVGPGRNCPAPPPPLNPYFRPVFFFV